MDKFKDYPFPAQEIVGLEQSTSQHLSRQPVVYALAYARRGWPVFPLHSFANNACSCGYAACGSAGKHPRTKNGVKDATTDPEQIRRWWTTWPNANIGIATGMASGLYVIDLDCSKGGDFDSLKDCGLAELMCSLIAKTGSGGYHIYLRCAEPLPNTANKLGPFIDTRGDGGYVVAAPGFNQHGQYTWANKEPILPMPPEMLAKLKGRSLVSSQLPSLPVTPPLAPRPDRLALEPIPETPALVLPSARRAVPETPVVEPDRAPGAKLVAQEARNMYLASMAGTLLGRGLTPEEARETLLVINKMRYGQGRHPQGPLTLEELERTVFKSLVKWQPGKTGPSVANTPLKELTTLIENELTPTVWIIPGLFPEGLVLLAGKPKVGKSWLALCLALSIASGSPALGKFELDPLAVLYISLEDSPARLRSRAEKVLAGRSAPRNFYYALEWEPLMQGGLQHLEAQLEEHPEIRVVFIDTLACVRSVGQSNGNVYQEDYALMGALHKLALAHHIALVLVHHTRKMSSSDIFDEISGSTGMTGAADTSFVLKRERGQASATLYTTGRDVDEQELALIFDSATCTWFLSGSADERRVSQARQEILDLLSKQDSLTPVEIAKALEKPRGAMRAILFRMVQDGLLKKDEHGHYAIIRSL